jgi:hypothetical protein
MLAFVAFAPDPQAFASLLAEFIGACIIFGIPHPPLTFSSIQYFSHISEFTNAQESCPTNLFHYLYVLAS